MIPYRAMFDVLHEVAEHVSWLIYARRVALRPHRHRLHRFRQTLLTLVRLRTNAPPAEVAAGQRFTVPVEATESRPRMSRTPARSCEIDGAFLVNPSACGARSHRHRR